jgi:hypothetical protein
MNISLQILVDVEKEMGKILDAQRVARQKMGVNEYITNLEFTADAHIAHARLASNLISLLNQQIEIKTNLTNQEIQKLIEVPNDAA